MEPFAYCSPNKGEDPCLLRKYEGLREDSAGVCMPGNGNSSGVLIDSPSTSESVTLIKPFRNCLFFFFDSAASGSEAPSVLSAFAPGWENGESSMFFLFECWEPGVALGEALGLRGRGNEILKLRVIEEEEQQRRVSEDRKFRGSNCFLVVANCGSLQLAFLWLFRHYGINGDCPISVVFGQR